MGKEREASGRRSASSSFKPFPRAGNGPPVTSSSFPRRLMLKVVRGTQMESPGLHLTNTKSLELRAEIDESRMAPSESSPCKRGRSVCKPRAAPCAGCSPGNVPPKAPGAKERKMALWIPGGPKGFMYLGAWPYRKNKVFYRRTGFPSETATFGWAY